MIIILCFAILVYEEYKLRGMWVFKLLQSYSNLFTGYSTKKKDIQRTQ